MRLSSRNLTLVCGYEYVIFTPATNFPEPVKVGDVLNQNLHSRVVLDEDGSVGTQYGAYAIPTLVVIDREGIVRYVSGERVILEISTDMRPTINKLL